MARRYSIDITPELRQKVADYHAWHGDQSAEIKRVIYDADGYPYLLVHILTAGGRKLSCIEYFDYDGDVFEMESCRRSDEQEMVKQFRHR